MLGKVGTGRSLQGCPWAIHSWTHEEDQAGATFRSPRQPWGLLKTLLGGPHHGNWAPSVLPSAKCPEPTSAGLAPEVKLLRLSSVFFLSRLCWTLSQAYWVQCAVYFLVGVRTSGLSAS